MGNNHSSKHLATRRTKSNYYLTNHDEIHAQTNQSSYRTNRRKKHGPSPRIRRRHTPKIQSEKKSKRPQVRFINITSHIDLHTKSRHAEEKSMMPQVFLIAKENVYRIELKSDIDNIEKNWFNTSIVCSASLFMKRLDVI